MELTFRYPSKAIQYGFVEVKFSVDDMSPEQIADMYTEHLVRYQITEIDAYAEIERKVREGITDIGGKVVEIKDNPPEEAPTQSEKPWDNKPKAQAKPWEAGKAPKFSFPKK